MPQARLARGTFPLRAVKRAPSRVAATEPTGLLCRVYRAGGALMEWLSRTQGCLGTTGSRGRASPTLCRLTTMKATSTGADCLRVPPPQGSPARFQWSPLANQRCRRGHSGGRSGFSCTALRTTTASYSRARPRPATGMCLTRVVRKGRGTIRSASERPAVMRSPTFSPSTTTRARSTGVCDGVRLNVGHCRVACSTWNKYTCIQLRLRRGRRTR